jgi:hypothetical protein
MAPALGAPPVEIPPYSATKAMKATKGIMERVHCCTMS